MRTVMLRLRQLMLAAFLAALLVPVAASTAQADEGGCSTPLQTFTFVAAVPGSVVGLPGNPIATITTLECFTGSIATGTFTVTVSTSIGTQTIGSGTLIAFHSGCQVAAFFEGKTVLNQQFEGSLWFDCVNGKTIVDFDDVGTVTVTFKCYLVGSTYYCLPGVPTFTAAHN